MPKPTRLPKCAHGSTMPHDMRHGTCDGPEGLLLTTRTRRRVHKLDCYESGSLFGMASCFPITLDEAERIGPCHCPGVEWPVRFGAFVVERP